MKINYENSPFNKEQVFYMIVAISMFFLSGIGIIVMSILGATDFSFHLIDLEIGWGGKLWDCLWLIATANIFFVIGGAFFVALLKNNK